MVELYMVAASTEPVASSGERPPPNAVDRFRLLLRRVFGALWFAVVPALLTAIALRVLLPPVTTGANDVAKAAFRLGEDHPVPFAMALFLAFAGLAGYWRDYLPGARLLSGPPTTATEQVSTRRRKRELIGLIVAMAAAAAIALGVRRHVVESYGVLSGSMLPTLEPEDRVIGNRLAYGWSRSPARPLPHRGDIIVFSGQSVDAETETDGPDYLVKRIIGLPGDRISMRGGLPVINGWSVPVCDAGEYLYVVKGGDNGLNGRVLVEFLGDRAYLTVHAIGSAAFRETFVVPPGELFVLGDNRNNSSDSRAWNDHHGGGVPFEAVEARVEWFIAGKRGDKLWDFGRLLRSVDSLATTLHLAGVDARPIQEGIARCLRNRPERTEPPELEPDAPALVR
jgi:signal peptidase I